MSMNERKRRGRKPTKLPIKTVFVEPLNDVLSSALFTLEQLDSGQKYFTQFEPNNIFPYNESTIEQIHRNLVMLFKGYNIQVGRRVTKSKYEYYSCKNNVVYKILNTGNCWECDCQYFVWFVKTGQREKPCHHIQEIELYEANGHLQNLRKPTEILS